MSARTALLTLAIFAAALVSCDPPAQASATVGAQAEEDVRLEGTFTWNMGGDKPTDITARFSPQADGTWEATFEFRFNGSRHRWRGPFSGDLENGTVEGVVTWGRGRRLRTWEVRGTAVDGKISVVHSERSRKGSLEESGRMDLEPAT